jgi:hypothetical protein
LTEDEIAEFGATVMDEWRVAARNGIRCLPHAILFDGEQEEVDGFDLSELTEDAALAAIREMRDLARRNGIWLLLVAEGFAFNARMGIDGIPLRLDEGQRCLMIAAWGPNGSGVRLSAPIDEQGAVGVVTRENGGESLIARVEIDHHPEDARRIRGEA